MEYPPVLQMGASINRNFGIPHIRKTYGVMTYVLDARTNRGFFDVTK